MKKHEKTEERLARRIWCIQRTTTRRDQKMADAERKTQIDNAVTKVLKNDNASEQKTLKRPGVDSFLEVFSFIPQCPHDKRLTPAGREQWKCHSFNEERQYIEFFSHFIYPYYIPEPLLLVAVLQSLYYIDKNGEQKKTFDYDIIQLDRKWLVDIVCGKSFYKQNKDYFTKLEAHYFLSGKTKYINANSVLHMFFEAKCKARNMPDSLAKIILRVFTVKFEQCFNNGMVTGFLDLLARHKDYHIAESELGDVCDFVLTEITKKNESSGKSIPFSFSGRTITSVIALANEWHAQVQREGAIMAEQQANAVKEKQQPVKNWKGLPIYNFNFENDECTWTITQLCNIKKLLNEGREMKNCVASYASKCASGFSAIFSVSGSSKKTGSVTRRATVEVKAASRSITQIRGKCNALVDATTINIIRRWAQTSNLKMSVL